MALERVLPQRGVRPVDASVTVAWRQDGTEKHRRWILVIGITGALLSQLGWKAKDCVVVERDVTSGRMVLTRVEPSSEDALTAFVLQSMPKSKTGRLKVPLRDLVAVGLQEKDSQLVKHAVDGAVLAIVLPDWAAPMRAGIRRAEAAAAVARAKIVAA